MKTLYRIWTRMRGAAVSTGRVLLSILYALSWFLLGVLVAWALGALAGWVWNWFAFVAPELARLAALPWYALVGLCDDIYAAYGIFGVLGAALLAGFLALAVLLGFVWLIHFFGFEKSACIAGYVLGLFILYAFLWGSGELLWRLITLSPPLVAFVEGARAGVEMFAASLSMLEWIIIGAAILLGVLVLMRTAGPFIKEWFDGHRSEVLGLIIGDVDPLFPRRPLEAAEKCAEDRRQAIEAFIKKGTMPARHHEPKFTKHAATFVREYVERRQEVTEVRFERAPEFLEKPRGARIIAKNYCVEGAENIAGQYSRLQLEIRLPSAASASGHDVPDETLLLLLGRAVDAAILADRHHDGLREAGEWNALPFFERIYAEYRPIRPPLSCFLRPIIGGAFPGRVVIETSYPEVFRTALFGSGKAKRNAFGDWFGIGIKIATPNAPQSFASRMRELWKQGARVKVVKIERSPWFKAQTICRRLKSRITSVVSGKVEATFRMPPLTPQLPSPDQKLDFHVMPCGPLADGCPSIMSDFAPRGTVSNAPPMWLLRAQNNLHPDCKGVCVKSAPPQQEAITVDLNRFGTMQEAASELAEKYIVPGAKNLKVARRLWMGAFFDRDLRLANRFPVVGCALRGGETTWTPIEPGESLWMVGKRADLRGAFAKPLDDRGVFGGVFVSVNGPEHASNLLLPASLLVDFLNYVGNTETVIERLPSCDQPEFVPSPEQRRSR